MVKKKFNLRGIEYPCILFLIEIISFILGLKVDMGHGGAIIPIFASLIMGLLVMFLLIIAIIRCIISFFKICCMTRIEKEKEK